MYALEGELILLEEELTGDIVIESPVLTGDLIQTDILDLHGDLIPIYEELTGDILLEEPVLVGELVALDNDVALSGDLTIFRFRPQDAPVYDGVYEVIPLHASEQILGTNEKWLIDDITVLPIPYHETSNSAGGMTVTIG